MNGFVRGKAVLAVAVLPVLALGVFPVLATVPASAATSPTVSVTSPSYDAPGGTVMTVVTVSNVPAGYTISALSARVGAGTTSCDPFRWSYGTSVSQKCFVNLPTKAGSWIVRATARLTKSGSPTLVYVGSKAIKARGTATLPASASVRALVTKCYNPTRYLQLTFDDGYTSQANLNSVLSTLKTYNVRGQFFLVGSWTRTHPSMMRQIRAAGHLLGNHTSTHGALNQISNASVSSEIANGQRANTSPRLLRPPGGAGAYTSRLYYLAQRHGYRLCHWGSDTRDWSGVSAATIVRKVVRGDTFTPPARAGDPILMHLSNTQTRYALPTLIKALRAKGLAFPRLR